MLVACKNKEDIQKAEKKMLEREFDEMKEMGTSNEIMDFSNSKKQLRNLCLYFIGVIERVLARFNVIESNHVLTPLVQHNCIKYTRTLKLQMQFLEIT